MSANIKILNDLKNFIAQICIQPEFRKHFTSSSKDFSRNRELSFERTALMLLNFFKKSYSVEIAEFYTWIGCQDLMVSKSAFCQQRLKIDSIFFDCLNLLLVDSFYSHYASELKRWHGMRLIAIDGSTSYLVNKKEVVDHFGTHSNQRGAIPMARILTAFDVLNELTIKSGIYPIKTSEQKVALSWIEFYESDMLVIYDRGFPGFLSIFHHQCKEIPQPFLMRCPVSFNNEVKAFVNSGRDETVCCFHADKNVSKELLEQGFIVPKYSGIEVRLIKVILDDGSVEILVTNLFDREKYPYSEFKSLYFMRWGIETRYDCLKNKIQMEAYSGQKVLTLKQDFYISIFLSNLQSIIKKPCQKYVDNISTSRKLNYKINQNIAIGVMKNRIIDLFLKEDSQIILAELEKLFCKHIEPIRPNRQLPRKVHFKRRSGKYQALTNYKRAI